MYHIAKKLIVEWTCRACHSLMFPNFKLLFNFNLKKNAFQSKAHLPFANRNSNTYNLTLVWPWHTHTHTHTTKTLPSPHTWEVRNRGDHHVAVLADSNNKIFKCNQLKCRSSSDVNKNFSEMLHSSFLCFCELHKSKNKSIISSVTNFETIQKRHVYIQVDLSDIIQV